LKLDNPSTQSHPDETYDVTDEKGNPVSIRCWKHMHSKEARWLDLTIIQVIRPHASDKERDPRISWFVYIGQDPQEGIAQVALYYCLRFGQEHGYRFDKQALLWTEPHLQTPEQFDLWSHIVAIVHNHLVIARDFIDVELRPWENKQRVPTPQQVRRGLAKFLSLLGTPARPPQNPWKIVWPPSWGQTSQTNTLPGDSQETYTASTCFTVTQTLASQFEFSPFHGTSSAVLAEPFVQTSMERLLFLLLSKTGGRSEVLDRPTDLSMFSPKQWAPLIPSQRKTPGFSHGDISRFLRWGWGIGHRHKLRGA
jgi:hypothetical protein